MRKSKIILYHFRTSAYCTVMAFHLDYFTGLAGAFRPEWIRSAGLEHEQ